MHIPIDSRTRSMHEGQDLSIVRDGVGPLSFLIHHRLSTGLWIDHDQATVRQSSVWREPLALSIWSPLTECICHMLYHRSLTGNIILPINPSSNTAHLFA